MNNDELPQALQPTSADRARMAELDAEATRLTGGRVIAKDYSNNGGYNRTVYGADGSIVDKVVDGQSQASIEQQAVRRAQSSANAEIQQIERDIQNLTDQRDEIAGYDSKGKPKYRRDEAGRSLLDKRINQLQLGRVNQLRLNETKWRKEAAKTFQRQDDHRARAAELAKELEAKGQVTRIPGF
ncbi:hypothetical protein [Erythrobacter sp. Alg231-14]|uniref:hypothetical protein n=1 Tax=Erythrobacter sp. Alg231-14 TaxID=1922225 RepID=UPI00307CB0D3